MQKIWWRIIVIFLLLLIGTCFAARAEDYDRHVSSVVIVVRPTGEPASGVVLAKNRVVTAYHVVQGFDEVGVYFHTDRKNFENLMVAKVVKTDPWADLALLEVKTPKGVKFVRIDIGAPPVGAEVFTIGHPSRNWWTYTTGEVSALQRHLFHVPEGYLQPLQLNLPIAGGSSGAPVFYEGKVVAFLRGANLQNRTIAYATPSEMLCKKLIPCRVQEVKNE